MTEKEKSYGKPWDGSGIDWFSVTTMKTLLIGQSVTREKYERTTGRWREKERVLARLSRGETVYRATAMSKLPPHSLPPPKKKTCNANVKICCCCNSHLYRGTLLIRLNSGCRREWGQRWSSLQIWTRTRAFPSVMQMRSVLGSRIEDWNEVE